MQDDTNRRNPGFVFPTAVSTKVGVNVNHRREVYIHICRRYLRGVGYTKKLREIFVLATDQCYP